MVCNKPGHSIRTGAIHLTAHHLIFHTDNHDLDAEIWVSSLLPTSLWVSLFKEKCWRYNNVEVPYPIIALVTRMPQTLQGLCPLAVRCRNFENFVLSFPREQDALDVFESIKELTVISKDLPPFLLDFWDPSLSYRISSRTVLAASVVQLYAFNYEPSPPLPTNHGWSIYSPAEEFARMGVGTRTKAWRFTDINKDYTVKINKTFLSLQ